MVHISIKVNINLEGTKANHSTLVSFVVQMILVYSGFLIESNCGYNLYNIVQKPHLNFKNKLWTYISVILLFTLLVSKSLPPSLPSFFPFLFFLWLFAALQEGSLYSDPIYKFLSSGKGQGGLLHGNGCFTWCNNPRLKLHLN